MLGRSLLSLAVLIGLSSPAPAQTASKPLQAIGFLVGTWTGSGKVADTGGTSRGTSTIAGSTATMDELFRTVAGLGLNADAGLAAAVQMTSATPARALGFDQVGSLRPGYDANLVVLDHDLQVKSVMVHGDWRPVPGDGTHV